MTAVVKVVTAVRNVVPVTRGSAARAPSLIRLAPSRTTASGSTGTADALGIVDGEKGYHRASDTKPVIICINVHDADAWYQRLVAKGVEIEKQPQESERLKIKVFMLKDPEGYVLEIQESLPGALSI